MTWRVRPAAIKRSERGSTSIEFAMILLPLSVLLFGSLELGYRIYGISVINGALREAARMASTGNYTGAQIDEHVEDRIASFRKNAEVEIVKKSYADFTGVGIAEPITSGSVASGTYCYDDINENSSWDEDQGTSGLGKAEDVVYYQVDMSYDALFAFTHGYMGMDRQVTISANTLVSNEPFAAKIETAPTNRCVAA